MTELTTEEEKTLRVLYELSVATLSEISEQLRLIDFRKKGEIIEEELSKLCKMDYAFQGNNFYEITNKGIVHFRTKN